MGTRFNLYKQFNDQAVSNTTTYTSPITNISEQHNVGLDITFTGTMSGTLSVQCSNDRITFKSLSFSPPLTQPTGSDLTYLVNLNQLPYAYILVVYTNSSGSGTLTSILSSKDLGS